ncbi:rRNA adenine N(6)-methyltransferase [Paragonimus heterotremus]|uniref:rRNA adenine N(6)-methyltransferase n=1 Tax=Paragonimus heterotremus TaxID=100268 RepID=A0A8J4WKF5_9TREM|nr:rRNA adenine N(6)-methyltransferase [Paragonimus heterotremus]
MFVPQPVHLPPLPSLREVLRIYGLRAQKQLSQNFLLQPASINGFVKCAGNLRDAYVLEVGPGPGGLTRAILECRPRHLAVIEIDRRFIPGLEELRLVASEMGVKMDIYRQDILQFNADGIFPSEANRGIESWGFTSAVEHPTFSPNTVGSTLPDSLMQPITQLPRVRAIGNLPFNISTPLVIQWLHDVAERRGLWRLGRVPMILTFQKEVAERLCADVWSKQRSRLSIMAQAYCEVKYLKDIPGTAFLPVPKVDAAIVRLTPLAQPLIPVPFPYVEKLVRSAFQFRNKQVVRCLETLFPVDRPDLVVQLFKEAAVQPVKRPTQLSLLEFRDLCTVYERICRRNENIFDFHYTARSNLPLWQRRKQIQREVLGTEHALTAEYVRQQMHQSAE